MDDEARFTMNMGAGIKLGFIRRPVSIRAEEGTIAFLDGLTAKGNPGREVGVFATGGSWASASERKLQITPHFWTVSAETEARRDAKA